MGPVTPIPQKRTAATENDTREIQNVGKRREVNEDTGSMREELIYETAEKIAKDLQ